MSVVLKSSAGGQVTLLEPTTASNFTQTLPAATGDVMVSGNMPAFFATIGSNQTLASSTVTKLQFSSEDFDTNSNYNTSTFRFTPTVAGYYQINLNQEFSVTGDVQGVQIQKNGNRVASGGSPSNAAQGTFMSACSCIVFCNGSTDYVEAFGYVNAVGGGTAFNGNSSQFSGVMVRAA